MKFYNAGHFQQENSETNLCKFAVFQNKSKSFTAQSNKLVPTEFHRSKSSIVQNLTVGD